MSPMGRPMHQAGKKTSLKETTGSLKKLAQSGKKYIPLFILSIVLILGGVIIAIIAPQYLSQMTDAIVDNAPTNSIDLNQVWRLAIILIALYVSEALMNYVSSFNLVGIIQDYAFNLRKSISEKINLLPLSYFDSHPIGDTLSRITNDVDSLSQSLDQAVTMLLQSIFMLIGSLIGMFATSWQMALTALACLPLIFIFLVVIMKFAMPQFMKRQQQIGKMNSIVEEKFSGQLIIKAFNAEEREDANFDKYNDELGSTMFKAQFFGGLMMPIMSFFSYFGNALILIVGGLLIGTKTPGISLGTITAFLVYVRLFQTPLTQIAQAMNSLQTVGAASKRVFDFLGEKEEDSEEGKTFKLTDDQGISSINGQVEFTDVAFSYDESREIIHDFSAKIKPGMKVAIVGPTGAGKTTMVNLLMRFYEINKGSITIDGINVSDMPRSEVREAFGMVLQDTWVYDGTIKDNIVYNTKGVTDEEVEEVIKEANLSHFVHTLPGGINCYLSDADSLSAGQKQLITIARAMLRKTPMMILDEATSNVDTRTEEAIQEAMDSLTKGKTSFVIAHRLSTIRNADMILVMKDGNIIETGNHDQLMEKNGFYASLYNSQFAFE
ncbi:MAG: ABC transporter ATP-binding protein [Bacilli bacterium]